MSLDFNISQVEDHEEVAVIHHYEKPEHTTEQIRESWKTEAIVFLTIAIGINQITQANHKEFAARIIMWEEVNGSYLRLGGESYRLTYEDVERRIGLSTNASTKTKTQFDKALMETLRTWAESRVAYAVPAAA